MDEEKLKKYIGWKWNILTKNTIENEFHPYKTKVCDAKFFNAEVFIYKNIRCLIVDDKIIDLRFN